MSIPTVNYVLSDTFPYEKTFYEDSGPEFADDYGWATCRVSSIDDSKCDVFVVDNRVLPNELPLLKRLIESSKCIFVLKLCDPYMEHAKGHFWYQFATMTLDLPNVHFLINYQPAEWTARLFVKSTRSKFVWAPYLYRAEKERPIVHSSRTGTMILSGAINPRVYPLRTEMNAMSQVPPLMFVTKRLPHPGYRNRTHEVIRSSYVDTLSRYRFGAVCSSRCRLEFLKYREFAYAGVSPVGDLPLTLLDCPADAWLPWRRNTFVLTAAMRDAGESQRKAEAYRAFMRHARDAESIRERVNGALSRL
jgi:hypothetical protein